jgi:hypothetical protein
MAEPQNLNKLREKFFSDPDWVLVEELLLSFVEPLKDMSSIDTNQPAEHVKAEIIARTISFERIADFLEQTGIVGKVPRSTKSSFR